MSDETITIEIPIGAAKHYSAHDGNGYHNSITTACRTALAKRRVDERAERLGLPWCHERYGVVTERRPSAATWAQGGINVARVFGHPDRVKLIAAAPEMAELLEDIMGRLEGSRIAHVIGDVRALLIKAGWIDG